MAAAPRRGRPPRKPGAGGCGRLPAGGRHEVPVMQSLRSGPARPWKRAGAAARRTHSGPAGLGLPPRQADDVPPSAAGRPSGGSRRGRGEASRNRGGAWGGVSENVPCRNTLERQLCPAAIQCRVGPLNTCSRNSMALTSE